MFLRPEYAVSDVYLLWQPTLWWMYARDCLRNVGLGIGTADVDAKVDAMTKLQAEFEKGSEVRPAPFPSARARWDEHPVFEPKLTTTTRTVLDPGTRRAHPSLQDVPAHSESAPDDRDARRAAPADPAPRHASPRANSPALVIYVPRRVYLVRVSISR